MITYSLRKHLTPPQAEALRAKFIDESYFDTLVTEDADGYDLYGNILFRFRKGAIPLETLMTGYNSFKNSATVTGVRGVASGGSFKNVRKDGTISKTTVGHPVESAIVGYMDESALVRYCRKTAFVKNYFDKFQDGIPFIQCVDKLYSELCPKHYARQIAIAKGTNRNYRIADTSFTTVTVNRNFQTAVHQDAGDLPDGFGNLCVYRAGHYEGAYLVLPEYRVAVDLHNTDILFMDVHKWHGNTPFRNESPDYLRLAFVMYYRQQMINCKGPEDELKRVKMDSGGFLKL